MKKISVLVFIFLAGVLYSQGQPPKYCTWKASVATSNVKLTNGAKAKITNTLQVDADNEGTCVWEKNEVYMKISVTTMPKGVNKSDAEDIFKAGQKFYLNNGHVTKGGTGRFIAKIGAVEIEGMYVVEVAIYNKAGKEIGSSSTIRFRYSD